MKGLAAILVLGLIGFVIPAFADEQIEFVSVWLKQPILEVDVSNFSEDNKAVDFSISFKVPTAGGWSDGMYCEMKTASDETGKDWRLKGDRQIQIKLTSLNNDETILAKEYSTISKGSVEFTYEEPFSDHTSLKLIPEELDGVKCIEGQFKNIYGDHLIIEGSLEYDDFSFEQEYKIDTWSAASMEDEVSFTLPSSESIPAPMEMPKDTEEEKLLESKIIPETKEIPEWVKNIFGFYYKGEIGDSELIGALQYLIKEGIIEV